MLEKLFISKVRLRMLEQFIFNPQAEYHVRGLVRIMEEEVNAVRRELLNLHSAGILKSQQKGNKHFYSLDHTCPIIGELTALMYKENRTVMAIREKLLQFEKVEVALLTQNYITGEYDSQFAIDLLVIGEVKVDKLKEVLKELEKIAGKELRTTLLTRQDFEFQMKKRDPFLLNILRKDRIVIIGSEKELA